MAGMVLFATSALPEFVSALVVLVLAMLLSLAPAEVVFSGLTSTACWLIFSGLVIGIAIAETGLAQRISSRFSRYLDSSYARLISGIVLMGVLLGFVMPSSVGRVVLFIPIALAIAEQLRFRPGQQGSAWRAAGGGVRLSSADLRHFAGEYPEHDHDRLGRKHSRLDADVRRVPVAAFSGAGGAQGGYC